jgi:hypothetical protein
MKKGRKAVAISTVFIAAMLALPAVYASITENTLESSDENMYTISGRSTASNTLVDVVVGTPDDEHDPCIEMDANGNLLVEYVKELSVFDSDVLLVSSTDGGSSWSSVSPPWGEPMGGRQFSTKLMYNPDAGMVIGGFADDISPSSVAFRTADVTNTDEYIYNGYPNAEIITDVSVTYFTSEETDVINVQTAGDASGFTGTCNWFYFTLETLEFFGQYYYYDAQSATGPYSEAGNIEGFAFADNHYGFVFEALREETGTFQPCIKWTTFEEEPDLEFVANQIWLIDDGTEGRDPDVAASGNSIYTTYGIFDPGDWGVVCKYSHDGGETWAESTVAPLSSADDGHPAIYASGNTVQIVYVNQGNLYLAKSADGGVTWDQPTQVNDQDGTVVSEDGTCDISKAGIVWTDNRNGNEDIYFAAGEAAPILSVKSVSGGFGVSAVIENSGTAEATDTPWAINLGGLVFLGGSTEGTIDIPAGGEVTVSSGLVFGIGPGTIDVNCGGATKAASCLVLGPLVLGVN